MRRRIDVEADDVAQFGPELGVARQLELTHPVRLQAVRPPDALYRTGADAGRLGHHRGRPVRRFAGGSPWVMATVRRNAGGQRWNARAPRLVAQQTLDPGPHKPLLPAPYRHFARAGSAHDLAGAQPVGRQQYDLRSPHVLLCTIPVGDDPRQPRPVSRAHLDCDPLAHAPSPLGRHKHTGL